MNELNNIFDEFFDIKTIPYYCLGLISFLFHLITDLLNRNKKKKHYTWYIQDFLYGIISIVIGISICYFSEVSKSVTWIILICCGMFGSTLIRILSEKKDDISNIAIDKISEKVIDSTSEKIGKTINNDKNDDCNDLEIFHENEENYDEN